MIDLALALHLQGFVRRLVVEDLDKLVESGLLLQEDSTSRLGGFFLSGPNWDVQQFPINISSFQRIPSRECLTAVTGRSMFLLLRLPGRTYQVPFHHIRLEFVNDFTLSN